MNRVKLLLLPLLLAALAACSDNNNDSRPNQAPQLNVQTSEAPIDLPGIVAAYAQDLSYGEGERNLLDIYLPDCDDPTPLVIYIHGGGFTGGDKSGSHNSNAAAIREFLTACVAYATINYTLLTVPSAEESTESAAAQGGVLTPMLDAARALQFLRYHARSLNLDPDNVAAFGGSAGAGTSLWLGTHDDMADPDNPDPVLRESTRLKAVGALATQATYDIIDWEGILFPITEPLAGLLGGTDVPTIAAAMGAENYLLTILGVASIEDIDSPENQAYRANVDMLELMDAGDAPIYTENFDTGLDNPMDMFLHHALHAIAVKNRADSVGLESVAYTTEDDPRFVLQDPSGESLTSFLMRHIR